MPSASCSSQTSASCKRVALLPSYTGLTDTSSICNIDDSDASDANPSGTSVPWGATASHGQLKGTTARSPALAADGTTRGKCRDVTRCLADQCTIGVVEVRLLPTKHHFSNFGQEREKRERHKLTDNTVCILSGHLEEGPRAGLLGQGLRPSRA
jgi:hypothetical protein